MNAGAVTGVAADKNFPAAHSVSQRITRITVNDNFAVVHGIADRVLTVSFDKNAAAVEISAECIPRCAFDGDRSGFERRSDITLTDAVENRDFFAVVAANQIVQFFKMHSRCINCFHNFLLFSGVSDAEDFEFFCIQAEAAQHQTVSFQAFDGVDTHSAHHLFDFVIPCR